MESVGKRVKLEHDGKRVKLEHDGKRAKLADSEVFSDKTIGTHSGTFQADEAMGVWLLRQTATYRNAPVVRSRDPAVLDKLDIVIDVGGIYDHEKRRYDHHQRGYDERFDQGKRKEKGNKNHNNNNKEKTTTMENGNGADVEWIPRCTRLSASGLVYRHYGKEVIRAFYPHITPEALDCAYVYIYDQLLEALDAVDTGVEPIATSDDKPVEWLYRDVTTTLAARVGRLNPRWNEVGDDDDDDDIIDNNNNNADDDKNTNKNNEQNNKNNEQNNNGNDKNNDDMENDDDDEDDMENDDDDDSVKIVLTKPDPDERFEKAVALCGQDFMSVMIAIVESEIPAQQLVEEAIAKRHELDSSGEIIRLPHGGMPWKTHLYRYEDEQSVSPSIKFVLYTDEAGMWRVQAVTVAGTKFENRLGLPEPWRGVRDEELAKVTGIPGARFCHAAGFIAGNDTFEGALQMARAALQQQQEYGADNQVGESPFC